jgi:GNAT superfamily N-acetyltransferase
MNLSDTFKFDSLELSRLKDSEVDETVALINPAYSYQEEAKGEPRTNPGHLRRRAAEADFYVVKDRGRIVGCFYLEPTDTKLHFGLLTVADDYRKTGLAPAIMKAIEKFAIDKHYKSLDLDYMSLAPWLKRYYESHGFKETGEVTAWGAIDLVHMTKNLQ